MIMMRLGSSLIARAAIAEIMPLQYARLLEQADRAVYRRDGYLRVEADRPLIHFLDVRMIVRFG